MENKFLEISGYVYKNSDEDIFLEDKKIEEEYYYPQNKSIGELVADHFSEITKSFEVSLSNWQRCRLVHYKDVFVQYFICNEKLSFDDAQENQIRIMAGDLTTEKRYDGYSEYTITDSWTEIFVGGHDLREELKSHVGKYAIIRIHYKISE